MQEKTRQRKITPRCSIIWAVNKEPGLLFSSSYVHSLSIHASIDDFPSGFRLNFYSIPIPAQRLIWVDLLKAFLISPLKMPTHMKRRNLFSYHITYRRTYFELLCGLDILFFTPFSTSFLLQNFISIHIHFHFVCTIVISARMSFFHFDAFNRVFIFLYKSTHLIVYP